MFGESLAGGGRPPLHATSFHSADNTDDDVVKKKKKQARIVGALRFVSMPRAIFEFHK